MKLFQFGNYTLHSGNKSNWKIDCDFLSDEDIETLAWMIRQITPRFKSVEGILTGGLRLAKALEKYIKNDGVHLIVDDVLTTGNSMESAREKHINKSDVYGAVIFARGCCSEWICPLFEVPRKLWHL